MRAEAIERIGELAHGAGDAASSALAEELLEQLPRGELNLLVVGQFKRGKSTLVNALLGDDVMPTGALPLTGLVTAIRYGSEPTIEVRLRRGAERRSITADELALYVTERCNPSNRLGVDRVDVAWPSDRIRGIALFDTPGVGSTFEHNTMTARAALPRADAAILVVGPEPPIGAEEARYAGDVVASSEHLFVVFNKSDLAGDALPEVLAFTRDAIARVAGDGEAAEIAVLSAVRAREAQRSGGEDAAFEKFLRSLRRFVDEQGASTRERSVRRRALAIVNRVGVLLAMRAEALGLPLAERRRRRELAERALQAIDDRVRALDLTVDDDLRRLRAELETQTDRLYEQDRRELATRAAEMANEPSARRRADRLEAFVADRASAWRSAALARAERALCDDAAKYARLLGELEVAALEAGCRAMHVDAGELTAHEVTFAPARLELAMSLVPTTGLEVIIALFFDVLPGPLRRPLLVGRCERTLDRELDALRGKLRYGIGQDLDPWRRSVHARISHSIHDTRESVLAAFGEIDAQAGTSEQPQLDRVHALQRDLDDVRRELLGESG